MQLVYPWLFLCLVIVTGAVHRDTVHRLVMQYETWLNSVHMLHHWQECAGRYACRPVGPMGAMCAWNATH
jgi:hypothetical protein